MTAASRQRFAATGVARSLRSGTCVGLFIFAQCLAGRVARAEPGIGTRLQYARTEHAATCPTEVELKSAVRQRLGYDPFFPAARQTIVVEIADRDGGLVGRVTLVDAEGIIRGARELSESAGNCHELVASLALAISITLDPSIALGSAEPPPTAEPKAAPSVDEGPGASESELAEPALTPVAPRALPAVPITRAARATEASVLGFGVRAGGLVAFGMVPSTTLGARLGASVRARHFSLVLEGFGSLPGSQPSSLGGRVRAALWAATLAPCFSSAWLSGCGLLLLGDLQARGLELESGRSVHLLQIAAGARVELDVPIFDAWYLLLNADFLKPLTPVRLRLHAEEVWATPAVSAALGAGLELRFR